LENRNVDRNLPGKGEPFRLSAEERRQLRQGVDFDALERLLTALPPEERPRIIDAFRASVAPPPDFAGPMWIREKPAFLDPALQRLLDAVYASVPRPRDESGPPLPQLWRDHVRRPFTLAAVPVLDAPGEVVAQVHRRAPAAGGDAVVLAEAIAFGERPDPVDVLAAAIDRLIGLRSSGQEDSSHGGGVSVGTGVPPPALPHRTRRALKLCLLSLANEPTRDVPGVGIARAVEVHLRKP
jgi:hypothetical protein